MYRKISTAIVAVIMPVLAFAQSALFDAEKLAAACHNDTCEIAVDGVLHNLRGQRLDEEQFNSQLGSIAAVLLDVGRGMADENLEPVVDALTSLADHSTDSLQRDAFRNVAQDLLHADPSLSDTSRAFAASPARPGQGNGRRGNGRGRPRFLGIF